MLQPIVPGGVTSYVSCLLRGGMNIRQGGDCCSMWLILSERHMEKKKGQMPERKYLPFKFVSLLLWANDRWRGVQGATPPSIRFRGIFGISLLEG